jgi:hypothetical protein
VRVAVFFDAFADAPAFGRTQKFVAVP